MWILLDTLTSRKNLPLPLANHVIEPLLYFAESGSLDTRRTAADRASKMLHKAAPNHLRASVALFQSIIHRLDGDFAGSDLKIQHCQSIRSAMRRDHALMGRLHLSRVENMIQRHDRDITALIYDWEPLHPPSHLEADTNRRLLLTTAKFFQSVGRFSVARDSLENCLALTSQRLLSTRSQPLIVSRLADIYCELEEWERARAVVEPEIDGLSRQGKCGRSLRRLILALVEVDIGQGRLGIAEKSLEEVIHPQITAELDINDQLLRVRALIARARIPHYHCLYSEALARWGVALHEVQQHSSFKHGRGFTTAVIYLSMAHAQLRNGDKRGGRQSWESAVDILRGEKSDYWIPVVATKWLSGIVSDIHCIEGLSVRIMTPEGSESVTSDG